MCVKVEEQMQSIDMHTQRVVSQLTIEIQDRFEQG